ncbi:bifunctional uroporphyrinogen-III C-methyltransferase/uroporphyrinogen-III synthase [Luteipulveratus sp. YIM 133132]|uniref:uroporphyrinogen-III synthase n=1 Tax=Luteipulveratus flavus TaxID=3031728 RepID=UPI0023AE7C2C|nr:bifunctional uroporphyrinogen-III C-methyltransferase/uroporphyrinogen-III synthase [Luteipulveratus sp. YIM 133132]MDE9365012.1 bifunctional uroporphyrinogen-III C-methyltransferase/uroporphyrinogen-III synthase [Luteipulveratus sp. YIM 133132]
MSTTIKSAAKSKAPARVAFVGAGPGDPGLLTVRAVDLLRTADVVVIDQIAREEFVAGLVREDVEVVDAGHGETGQAMTTASRAKLVVRTAKAAGSSDGDRLVVRLMDGDPATFNGLAEEAMACHKAGIAFEFVPGVSAVGAVPAYAGVPLTTSSSRSVHVIPARETKVDWSRSVDPETTVVVLGAPETLAPALAKLLDAGRDPQTPVALTAQGTTIQQSTRTTTLGEVVDVLGRGTVPFPTLAVVGAPVALRDQLSWWETKPLYGWNILVPRTKDQAGSMTQRLGTYGASSDVVPTISVEPPRTPQQMERAIKGLVTGRYEWIGFTSANAVRAVREKFVEYGLDVRAFAGLKIAAVGGVTADALREWGLEPDLVPSGEQSAHGLLEDWPDFDELVDPINRVFLPRADIATDTLVAGLQEMGWEVDDVTAYRTVRAAPPAPEIREAIKSGRFDAVCFTSSSTVRNLVGIAGKPHASTVVACIGPATAKTAEEHGLRVDVLASEASADALVDALADFGRGLALAAAEAGEPLRRPSEKKKSTTRRKVKA